MLGDADGDNPNYCIHVLVIVIIALSALLFYIDWCLCCVLSVCMHVCMCAVQEAKKKARAMRFQMGASGSTDAVLADLQEK